VFKVLPFKPLNENEDCYIIWGSIWELETSTIKEGCNKLANIDPPQDASALAKL